MLPMGTINCGEYSLVYSIPIADTVTLFLIRYSFDIKSTSFMSGNLPETNFDIIVIQRIINIYQLVTNVGLGPGH